LFFSLCLISLRHAWHWLCPRSGNFISARLLVLECVSTLRLSFFGGVPFFSSRLVFPLLFGTTFARESFLCFHSHDLPAGSLFFFTFPAFLCPLPPPPPPRLPVFRRIPLASPSADPTLPSAARPPPPPVLPIFSTARVHQLHDVRPSRLTRAGFFFHTHSGHTTTDLRQSSRCARDALHP